VRSFTFVFDVSQRLYLGCFRVLRIAKAPSLIINPRGCVFVFIELQKLICLSNEKSSLVDGLRSFFSFSRVERLTDSKLEVALVSFRVSFELESF
jgi:hypothetical protein